MSRDLEGAVVLVLGAVLARITLEGSYLAYVKSNLFWPLLATAVVLLCLGFATIRERPSDPGAVIPQGADGSSSDGHTHAPPRLGVLLLAPVVVLILAAPAPLGAFAAERGSVNSIAQEFAAELPALTRNSGPTQLTISEFVLRTFAEGDASVEGVLVELEGFVSRIEADGFVVARFAIACCAADASPRQVRAIGAGPSVASDDWVRATVIWNGDIVSGDGEARVPEVELVSVIPIEQPAVAYEYAVY